LKILYQHIDPITGRNEKVVIAALVYEAGAYISYFLKMRRIRMKPFPFDEFYLVFLEEVKSLFSRFISLNKNKKPYIFTVCAPDYIAINHPNSYCLQANGNTIVDFELTGFSYADPNIKPDRWELDVRDKYSDLFTIDFLINNVKGWGLCSKYSVNEWSNEAFRDDDFPKSNSIILDYVIKNEDKIADKDYKFTEEFRKFRTDFFNCLIKGLKQLRDEKFFETAYPEKVLINFEVREYYDEDERVRIFECLNTKEEAELFAEYV
jgi:hypothetical protein